MTIRRRGEDHLLRSGFQIVSENDYTRMIGENEITYVYLPHKDAFVLCDETLDYNIPRSNWTTEQFRQFKQYADELLMSVHAMRKINCMLVDLEE